MNKYISYRDIDLLRVCSYYIFIFGESPPWWGVHLAGPDERSESGPNLGKCKNNNHSSRGNNHQ